MRRVDKEISDTSMIQSILAEALVCRLAMVEEKWKALDIIMRKYFGRDGWDYGREALAKIRVIKVSIEHMTAKRSGWQSIESEVAQIV